MRDAAKDAIERAAKRARILEAGFRLMSARSTEAMNDGTLDIRVSEKRLFVGTLYAVLSVAGKFAEGLVYPTEDHHNMLEELLMIKQMILGALKKGRMGTVGTIWDIGDGQPPRLSRSPMSPFLRQRQSAIIMKQ